MKCGVVKETYPGERRVALVPAVLAGLAKAGLTAIVQAGVGQQAGFSDQAYRDQGATIVGGAKRFLRRPISWSWSARWEPIARPASRTWAWCGRGRL